MVSVLGVFGACDFAAWKRVAALSFNVGNLYWWVTHDHASEYAPTIGRWWPNVKGLRRWEFLSLVLPYLNYGLLLWGNGNKTCLDKVHKLQKRAFRTISNTCSPYLAPTKGLFKRFSALNIFDIYKKETGIFMYKYNNNILPQSFDGLFINHHLQY